MKMNRWLILAVVAMMLGSAWAQGPNNSGTYYANANGKSGAALRTALGNIINPHTNIGYKGLFDAYRKTDKRADGKVRDWYSNTTNYDFDDHTGGYSKEGDMYNREHSVPQSWFGSSNIIVSDIVHVIPTDGYVNNRRGNNPLAEVLTVTYQSNNGYSKLGSCKTEGFNGVVFEPNDEIKGDMARIYFYMATCYESACADWGNVFSSSNNGFESWYIDMLMRWAKQDPIDDVEIARNNAIYGDDVQGNRNPFVDYPGLEEYIWGDKKDEAFSYDGSVSGIQNIKENDEVEGYYSIDGKRLQKPQRGVNIVKTKSRRTKKIIKR
jgi:endonuclease I